MEVTPVPGADSEGRLLYVSGRGWAENAFVNASIRQSLSSSGLGGAGGGGGQSRHLGLFSSSPGKLGLHAPNTLRALLWTSGTEAADCPEGLESRSLVSCGRSSGSKSPAAPCTVTPQGRARAPVQLGSRSLSEGPVSPTIRWSSRRAERGKRSVRPNGSSGLDCRGVKSCRRPRVWPLLPRTQLPTPKEMTLKPGSFLTLAPRGGRRYFHLQMWKPRLSQASPLLRMARAVNTEGKVHSRSVLL